VFSRRKAPPSSIVRGFSFLSLIARLDTFIRCLAIIASAQCRSELEAFIGVEILATGFAGPRFLRQGQRLMTEDYISTYGRYANKLLSLQLELIQVLVRP